MDRKMRRNLRRLTAILLSAVMTMGSSLAAYANEPDMAQTSDSDVADNDEKVRVILPTDAVGIFDFILDPQELIYKTNAAAYEGKLFEEGATLFFKRTEGEALVDYSSTSDAVTITNKGEEPIDVVITAGITVVAKDEFAMTDDREFTDDTRPSLYLALTDGETEVPIMGEGEEAASLTITIPPYSEEEEEANECSFRLTGAANKGGDWSRMKNISFEVAVTWMIVAEEEEEVMEEEEMIPENEEAGLTQGQANQQPVSEPSKEIVRKIVPVVTDSNVVLDEEESEIPVTEETSDSKAEEEDQITEKNTEDLESPGKQEKQPEENSGMNEPALDEPKEMKGEKDVPS